MYLIHEPSRRRVYRWHPTRADDRTSLCGYQKAGEGGWEAVEDLTPAWRAASEQCGHCVNMRLRERGK